MKIEPVRIIFLFLVASIYLHQKAFAGPERVFHIQQRDASPGAMVDLVIGVLSARSHLPQREAIRETWWAAGHSSSHRVVLKFVVGTATEEQPQCPDCDYPDMLQVPVKESYKGLLDKLLHFVVWVMGGGVPSFRYLMKADDDTYICLPGLLSALEKAPPLRHYHGHIWIGEPVRDPFHKNFMSMKDYPLGELPPYAYGGAYVLSQDLVSYLYHNLNFLSPGAMRAGGNIEDVQVGLWMMALGVRPVHDARFVDALFCHSKAFVLFNASPFLMLILQKGVSLNGTNNVESFGLCSSEVYEWTVNEFYLRFQADPKHIAYLNQIGLREIIMGRTAEAIKIFEKVISLNSSDYESTLSAQHNLVAVKHFIDRNLYLQEIRRKIDSSLKYHFQKISIPNWTKAKINSSLSNEYVINVN